MASTASVRPAEGATVLTGNGGTRPGSLALKDTGTTLGYLWRDTDGALKHGDAVTVEAAGFNSNTGGLYAHPVVVRIDLMAASVDKWAFTADRAYKLVAIREVHSVVGGANAAVRPRKVTDTSAPGAAASATVIELSAAIDLTSGVAVNTSTTVAITATAAEAKFAAGDKLGLDFSGTLTGLVGELTLTLVPIE